MATNGFNQSAAWGGGASSSQGDASAFAQGGGLQPPKKRTQFQTAQPPQPQGAPAPQPTFAQMQQQGQARPNPAPVQQQPQNPVGGQLQQAVSQALTAPSRYDLPQVQQVRQALQGDLQQQYSASQKGLNEELARRGLSESTIAGQRYSDLASEHDRSLANLDAQLLQNYAATQAQDLSASLGAGQNYENAQQSGRQFDVQQALAEKLGLGGLGLQQQQLQQQGSQFDKSLAQSGHQFDLQQALAEQLGLGNLDLNKQQLAQSGSQFQQSLGEQQATRQQQGSQFNLQQDLARQLGLGNLSLQQQSLTQSGQQFDKSFQLQQAAQQLDEEVKRGSLTLQQAQMKLAELAQGQNYELGKSAQDIQKQQLAQSGSQGNLNLMLQYLNLVGSNSQPDLAAQIAKLLGIQMPKTAVQGGGYVDPAGVDPVTGKKKTAVGGTV